MTLQTFGSFQQHNVLMQGRFGPTDHFAMHTRGGNDLLNMIYRRGEVRTFTGDCLLQVRQEPCASSRASRFPHEAVPAFQDTLRVAESVRLTEIFHDTMYQMVFDASDASNTIWYMVS